MVPYRNIACNPEVRGSIPIGLLKKILITSILCAWRACLLFKDSILVYDKCSYQDQWKINNCPIIPHLK
jgi:hypothetical protein